MELGEVAALPVDAEALRNRLRLLVHKHVPVLRPQWTIPAVRLAAIVAAIPCGDRNAVHLRAPEIQPRPPLLGIFDLAWHEKTKYRLDPGFYNIELGVIFSAKTWNALTAKQKEFLNGQVAWLEGLNADMVSKDVPADLKRQADSGMVVDLAA